MDAIPFKEQNLELQPPLGDTECMTLPVWTDGTRFISKHKLTTSEIKKISETGVIWLHVFGAGHPPVALSVESPFENG